VKILLVYPVPPKVHWPKGLFCSQRVPSGVAYIGHVGEIGPKMADIVEKQTEISRNARINEEC